MIIVNLCSPTEVTTKMAAFYQSQPAANSILQAICTILQLYKNEMRNNISRETDVHATDNVCDGFSDAVITG